MTPLRLALEPSASTSERERSVLVARVRHELADALICSNWASPIGAFFLSLGLWGLCYYMLRDPVAWVWAVLMHSLQVHRLVQARGYVTTPAAQRDPLRSAPRYCNSLLASSVLWGLAPWLFFPAADISLVSMMMVMLLGVSSGGMAGMAISRRAIFSFIAPILLGLSTALLWQGGAVYTILGLATLVYMFGNIQFGLKQNRLLSDSLHTRYEKEDLAQRLEAQVRKVEQVNADKSRFFASASHDLRQPLHSLGLFGAAISARLKDTPDEPLAHHLMLCVHALETSFSAMLDVSKIDAGVVQVRTEPVALGDVFRRLYTNFGEYAQAQGLALRFTPGARWVLADTALLERVLGNLVHNAIKFTQHGGVVVVARGRHHHVSVQVWDTGPGIEPDELPRIFQEFYQVGNVERDRARGMGMGLAIVQRLSGLMGVTLKVASRPGRGTVFELLLPRCAPAHPVRVEPVRRETKYAQLAGRCVLVVDDEESVRLSTAAALRARGMTVESAEDASQARAMASCLGASLHAVIADYRLRDHASGVTLVAELRAELGRALPALLITGETAPERIRQAQESGLHVLYKPVSDDDLAQALCQELARALGR